MSASYQTGHDVAQWITNTDADGDAILDYVYGRLRRNVVSITGRTTYAFTKDLTLEAYVQPFVAVGDYHDTRKLARPSSFEFTPVTLGFDPDFNRKSVRGNVVLRWEYNRGSTMYFVWQTARADRLAARRVLPLAGPGHGVRGRWHQRVHGESELLVRAVMGIRSARRSPRCPGRRRCTSSPARSGRRRAEARGSL